MCFIITLKLSSRSMKLRTTHAIKTIIAGLAPTLVAALLAWTARKATLYIGKTTNEPLDISGSTNYKAMKQNESQALDEVKANSTYQTIKGDDDDLLPF